MPRSSDSKIKLVKTVNFGIGLRGRLAASPFNSDDSTNIKYSIYNTLGAISASRSDSGVYEMQILGAGTGVYGTQLLLSQSFSGSILWEITASNGNVIFASDEIEIDARVTRKFTAGQWIIDKKGKEMIFYDEENGSELGRFGLFDDAGRPSVDSVFRRSRILTGSE